MVFLMRKWRIVHERELAECDDLSLLESSNLDRLREIAQKSASQPPINTFGGMQECQAWL